VFARKELTRDCGVFGGPDRPDSLTYRDRELMQGWPRIGYAFIELWPMKDRWLPTSASACQVAGCSASSWVVQVGQLVLASTPHGNTPPMSGVRNRPAVNGS